MYPRRYFPERFYAPRLWPLYLAEPYTASSKDATLDLPGEKWKTDNAGYFIEMEIGDKEKYSIDFTRWLGDDDDVSSVVWTIPDGVTKVIDIVRDDIGQVILLADGDPGIYDCHVKMTSASGLIKILKFRIVVS